MTEGFRANLLLRLATAALALPLLWALLIWGSPAAVVGVVAAALLWGLVEFSAFVRAAGLKPLRGVGLLVATVLFAQTVFPGAMPTLFPAAAALLFLEVLKGSRDFHSTVSGGAATLLGAAYLGGLGGTLAALRVLPPEGEGGFRILLLLAIVMGSDTAAFFVGHTFGRRQLSPALSPGKTVEGALGGLLGGALGALAIRSLGLPGLPPVHAVGLGILVAALGAAGDLFESLLKRWAGVKDSGTAFPGHGGMLDRLDSLLFGAPILYYYFVCFR